MVNNESVTTRCGVIDAARPRVLDSAGGSAETIRLGDYMYVLGWYGPGRACRHLALPGHAEKVSAAGAEGHDQEAFHDGIQIALSARAVA